MKTTRVLLFTVVVGSIIALAFAIVGLDRKTCHNQCSHGDRTCQDLCFRKGFCPSEDRSR